MTLFPANERFGYFSKNIWTAGFYLPV